MQVEGHHTKAEPAATVICTAICRLYERRLNRDSARIFRVKYIRASGTPPYQDRLKRQSQVDVSRKRQVQLSIRITIINIVSLDFINR